VQDSVDERLPELDGHDVIQDGIDDRADVVEDAGDVEEDEVTDTLAGELLLVVDVVAAGGCCCFADVRLCCGGCGGGAVGVGGHQSLRVERRPADEECDDHCH